MILLLLLLFSSTIFITLRCFGSRLQAGKSPNLVERDSLTYLLTYLLVTYLLNYLLTYSTQQSPSLESNRFSASQEIPRILRNPKVHYRIHKRPPPAPILSQINPVHASLFHLSKNYFNIILPSMLMSFKSSLSLMFCYGDPVCTCPPPHTCYMPRPSYYSLFDNSKNIL